MRRKENLGSGARQLSSPEVSGRSGSGEAQAAGADAQFGEAENLHDRLIDGHTHEDDVGTVFREAEDVLALVQRQTPEPLAVPPTPTNCTSATDGALGETRPTCEWADDVGDMAVKSF